MTADLSDDDKRAVLQELADAGYLMCPKWVADATRRNPGVVTRLGDSDVSWVNTAEQDRLVEAHEAALSALADAEMGEAGRSVLAQFEHDLHRHVWAAAYRRIGEDLANRGLDGGYRVYRDADRIEAGELTPWAETDPEPAPTSTESAEPAPAPTHGPPDAPRGSQGAGQRWRVAGKVPRNLYRETAEHPDGEDIGRMDTAELAAQVVEAVNASLANWRECDEATLELATELAEERTMRQQTIRERDTLAADMEHARHILGGARDRALAARAATHQTADQGKHTPDGDSEGDASKSADAPGWIARTWNRDTIDQLITALERAWTVDRQRQGAQLRALLADRDRLHAAQTQRRTRAHQWRRGRDTARADADDLRSRLKATSDAYNDARNEVERMRPVLDAARIARRADYPLPDAIAAAVDRYDQQGGSGYVWVGKPDTCPHCAVRKQKTTPEVDRD